MATFIFCTNTNWHNEPPRCRHQLARQFAKFGKVIFIQKGGGENKSKNPEPGIFIEDTPVMPFSRKLELLIPFLKMYENLIFNRFLRKLIKKEEEIFILNFRYNLVIANDIKVPVFYVCNDEFTIYHPWPISKLLAWYEKQTIRRSDLSFAISMPLVEKIKKISSKVLKFNPGLEVSDYEQVPNLISKTGKKISVGHGGFLNNRLDYEVIEKLARNENFSVEIFGKVEGTFAQEKMEEFKKLGVKVSGPSFAQDFFNKLSEFDALIIPYLILKNTSAISMPNKVLQYLQTGRPVFITAIPHLDKDLYPVVQAMQGNDWGKIIIETIQTDSSEKQMRRIGFSKLYTWENSAKLMWEQMQKL